MLFHFQYLNSETMKSNKTKNIIGIKINKIIRVCIEKKMKKNPYFIPQ